MKHSEINRPATVLSVIEHIYLSQSFDPRYETGCIYSYRSVDYRDEKWIRVDWKDEESYLLVRDYGDEEAECLWFADKEADEPEAVDYEPLTEGENPLAFMLAVS